LASSTTPASRIRSAWMTTWCVNVLRAIVTLCVLPPMSAPSIVSPSMRRLAAAEKASAIRADAPGSGRIVTAEGLTAPSIEP
jgi:hypothetical protein